MLRPAGEMGAGGKNKIKKKIPVRTGHKENSELRKIMSVENVERGMEHLNMRDDGDEYSEDEVDRLFALSDDEGAQLAIASSSSGGGGGETPVDLGALITMECLESPESHAVLKELSIKCTKAHPFASVPSGGHLPAYIMFDEGAAEQMDWELEMGSARPSWRTMTPRCRACLTWRAT